MSVNITYFVHGTTTDNEAGIATGSLPGELSAHGMQQAEELGEIVADKKFDAVFCSDLQRAVDSAQFAFGKRYQIIQDKRLREINYGDWNGTLNTFKLKMAEYIDKKYPQGECYRDVEERVASFLLFLTERFADKHIAIVAHQAPQLALEVLCKGKTWVQAIANDWRNMGDWKPGWEYEYM